MERQSGRECGRRQFNQRRPSGRRALHLSHSHLRCKQGASVTGVRNLVTLGWKSLAWECFLSEEKENEGTIAQCRVSTTAAAAPPGAWASGWDGGGHVLGTGFLAGSIAKPLSTPRRRYRVDFLSPPGEVAGQAKPLREGARSEPQVWITRSDARRQGHCLHQGASPQLSGLNQRLNGQCVPHSSLHDQSSLALVTPTGKPCD